MLKLHLVLVSLICRLASSVSHCVVYQVYTKLEMMVLPFLNNADVGGWFEPLFGQIVASRYENKYLITTGLDQICCSNKMRDVDYMQEVEKKLLREKDLCWLIAIHAIYQTFFLLASGRWTSNTRCDWPRQFWCSTQGNVERHISCRKDDISSIVRRHDY